MEWLPNVYQLKTLLLVDEYRTFRGAAEAQHITVSAVSQQMLNLSRRTNAVLYERRGNEVRLASAGRKLADFAQQIIKLTEQAADAMVSSDSPRQLRVSTVTSIAEGILLPLYRRFRGAYGDVTLQIDIKQGSSIVDGLNSGVIDIGLIPIYTEGAGGLGNRVPRKTLRRRDRRGDSARRSTDRFPHRIDRAARKAAPLSGEQVQSQLPATH